MCSCRCERRFNDGVSAEKSQRTRYLFNLSGYFHRSQHTLCLHTFCCECLKKHALISQRNGKFCCPECQAEVDLPEANCFDKLPSSFHHNRLLSLLSVRQSGDGNEISCGICKKKSAEISYCFECAKFMYSDCVNAHQLFTNLTEGHKVTPVKQF